MKRIHVVGGIVLTGILFLSQYSLGQQPRKVRQLPGAAQQEVLYLTPEQEKETLEYAQEVYPDKYERLMRVKDLRPELYRKGLSLAFREMRYLGELKDRDPDQYQRVSQEKQLETQSRFLAVKYKETEDENEKIRMKNEIYQLLNQIFDLRQLNRQVEIERLEKRLAEAKAINNERLQNKDEIIELKMNEMLGENKGMEW